MRLSPFARLGFWTGIICHKLVEPVFYTRHIIIRAVGVDGVEMVIDCDVTNPIFREGEVDIQSCQCRVLPQPREVFSDTS